MRDLGVPAAGVSRLLGAVAVTVAVVVGVLAGCSQKQEASTTLPTSSAPEPAPTTEALPPIGPADFPVPDEARTKDAASAEAFLRYYVDLINHQRAIPAGQPLRELGPDCDGCLRIARNYDQAADAGNRYVGGHLSLNDVTQPEELNGRTVISFGLRQEAVSIVNSAGDVINPGNDTMANVISGCSMTWSGADRTWIMTGFDLG